MRNSQFSAPPDANDVLVQSFQLDADADDLSLPICCPGKQAMFHVPRNFSSHLSSFIPYEEGVKMIKEINQILLKTAFPWFYDDGNVLTIYYLLWSDDVQEV